MKLNKLTFKEYDCPKCKKHINQDSRGYEFIVTKHDKDYFIYRFIEHKCKRID